MKNRTALAGLIVLASSSGAAAQTRPLGERLYHRDCAACHTIARGSGSSEGPSLRGVVGRKIASVPGYRYSPALRRRGKEVWTAALLDRFLQDSQKFALGSNMVYFSEDPRERAALIAFMRSAAAVR